MMKVKLQFQLVGKSDTYKKYLPATKLGEWTNENTLELIKDTVANYFGDRAVFVFHEETLRNNVVKYPKFFSAGWFVSQEKEPHELVVISHGDTMEEANKSVVEATKILDWNSLAVKI